MPSVEHDVAEAGLVNLDEVPARRPRRLAIVEDHALIARVLAETLRGQGAEVEVVEPGPVEDVVDRVAAVAPDCVLHDLDLGPHGTAIEHIRQLTAKGHRVLVLTGVDEPARLGACLEAGAVAVVDKARSFTDLLRTMESVLDGRGLPRTARDHELLAALRRERAEARRRQEPFERLTRREAQTLGELVAGRTVDQIAEHFTVSVTTIRTHVRAILSKLGVQSQLAAVGLAREAGWAPPDRRT
jgi:two-component system nitrate/nitrite response regulator NarL